MQEFVDIMFGCSTEGVVPLCRAVETEDRVVFPWLEYHPRRCRTMTHIPMVTVTGDWRSGGNLWHDEAHMVEACHISLDDVGTKAAVPPLSPTAVVETKPGNFTYFYAFSKPCPIARLKTILHSLSEAGYLDENCDDADRVNRLPGSLPPGKEHRAELVAWDPECVYDPDEIVTLMEAEERELEAAAAGPGRQPAPQGVAIEDPVFDWLQGQGLIGAETGAGFYMLTRCPWAHLHSDDPRADNDTAKYKPATEEDVRRVYHCFRTHHHTAVEYEGEMEGPHGTAEFLAWVAEQGGPTKPDGTPLEASALLDSLNLSDLADLVDVEALRRESVFTAAGGGTGGVERAMGVAGEDGGGPMAQIMRRADQLLNLFDLPDLKLTQNGAPRATQPVVPANLEYVLSRCRIEKRFNFMGQAFEYVMHDPELREITEGWQKEQLIGAIAQCASVVSLNIGSKDLNPLPYTSYHPMEEWLKSLPPWDGVERLPELPIVHVDDAYPDYVRAVLRRWLIQCVQAACGWRAPKQIGHVLILAGAQGKGKTRWFTEICPGFGYEGATLHLGKSITGDRDAARAAMQAPIVELGEIETTFGKSEQGAMKNFLTRTSDTYRIAYSETEITVPRATSFGGSVNHKEILRDVTGQRRYWPVLLRSDDFRAPRGEEMEQLWAEMYHRWQAGESWFLDDAEQEMHERYCEMHRDVSEAEDLMGEHFPNGFVTVPPGGDGQPNVWAPIRYTTYTSIQEMQNAPVLMSLTNIKGLIGVKGPQHNTDIRAYVEKHGGKFGRYTDKNGKRHNNVCVAMPSDREAARQIRRLFSGLKPV